MASRNAIEHNHNATQFLLLRNVHVSVCMCFLFSRLRVVYSIYTLKLVEQLNCSTNFDGPSRCSKHGWITPSRNCLMVCFNGLRHEVDTPTYKEDPPVPDRGLYLFPSSPAIFEIKLLVLIQLHETASRGTPGGPPPLGDCPTVLLEIPRRGGPSKQKQHARGDTERRRQQAGVSQNVFLQPAMSHEAHDSASVPPLRESNN